LQTSRPLIGLATAPLKRGDRGGDIGDPTNRSKAAPANLFFTYDSWGNDDVTRNGDRSVRNAFTRSIRLRGQAIYAPAPLYFPDRPLSVTCGWSPMSWQFQVIFSPPGDPVTRPCQFSTTPFLWPAETAIQIVGDPVASLSATSFSKEAPTRSTCCSIAAWARAGSPEMTALTTRSCSTNELASRFGVRNWARR